MIALSMQMRQQRVVSHLLLRHPVLARAHTARWQAALSSEADLSAALAGEGRWMVSSFNTDMSQELRRLAAGNFPGKDEASMVARLEKTLAISQKFYLHHETLNRFYRAYRVAMRLADVPADQIDAQVTRVAQEQVIIGQPWWKRPYFGLRNQLGNILLEMGQPDIQRYIERAHDVEGHRRLVLLQLAAYSAGLEAADMPDWLGAAGVDGAGMLRTYVSVVLPISVPSFVVVLIWQFTSAWNDFLFALFFGGGAQSGPVTLALNNLAHGSILADYGASMSGALIASVPTLAVYILLGKYFVGGLMAGSVKG